MPVTLVEMPAALVLMDDVTVDKLVDIWLLLALMLLTLVEMPAALVLIDDVTVDMLLEIWLLLIDI